ncbi:hypothetical protein F5878DRAFT_646673 [Lentinula raphanica]|uniref:Uncharacterized protein n=1 Tax=Lentinula raphanica TaxID=153919 RepID=A0AA38NXP0_9AGAR|nr:hypothetical protein F5878DRAFT_646673 [Lentinula raphanica]
MPARNSPRSSGTATPMTTRRTRRRLSPSHTLLGPPFNGGSEPELLDQLPGSTLGLYFGRYQAIAERKRFASVSSVCNRHQRFIDVRDGFSSDTDADDIYKIRVVVDNRRYYVCGTYDQSSHDTNESVKTYGVTETFKGDIVIFFHTIHEPGRFLDYLPRFPTMEEREEISYTSEGWFILMDVEGDSNLRYRREPPASSVIATIVSRSYQKLTLFQLLGWQDGHNKAIESEDESHSGSKDDSDTESQRSMFQVTDMAIPVDIQKLTIEEAPTQNLEQIDSKAKPGASNSLEDCSFVEGTPRLGTEMDNVFMKTTKALEDQSVEATAPPSSAESTVINEKVKFQVDAVTMPSEESPNFSSNLNSVEISNSELESGVKITEMQAREDSKDPALEVALLT